MAAPTFVRGQVYFAVMPQVDEPKPYLVVSNNARNTKLGTALVVRITTTDKRHVRTAVPIPEGECCAGYALCDDIEPMYPEDVSRYAGALSLRVMQDVGEGLRVALALR